MVLYVVGRAHLVLMTIYIRWKCPCQTLLVWLLRFTISIGGRPNTIHALLRVPCSLEGELKRNVGRFPRLYAEALRGSYFRVDIFYAFGTLSLVCSAGGNFFSLYCLYKNRWPLVCSKSDSYSGMPVLKSLTPVCMFIPELGVLRE